VRIGLDGRYLSDAYPGIGRYVFNLVRALAAAATPDDEIVLLHDPAGVRTRLQPADLRGPRVSLAPAPIRPRSLAEQVALPRLVRGLRLDLFHAPYPFTALASPCPRVVTVYDLTALHPRHGVAPSAKRALAALVFDRVVRSAAAVLTPSRATRDALQKRLRASGQPVVVTGAAAGPELRPAPGYAIESARRALGFPARYVLHLGTDKPHKNLDRLLQAWARLPRGRDASWTPPAALVLAGTQAAGAQDLRRRAQALGLVDVHVTGPVVEEHLAALLTGADVLVVPSLDEGYGLPVAEAMACGTPVACAFRGALPEVAGRAAAFFDPEDVAAIAWTLGRLLDDDAERQELRRRGLEQAREATWGAAATRAWAVYRAVARGTAVDAPAATASAHEGPVA
jgi:glycosyltransferase involved in cell wall biosynthesis